MKISPNEPCPSCGRRDRVKVCCIGIGPLHPGNDATRANEKLRWAANFVHDTFKRDLARGYKTRDKEFAVDVLGLALTASVADAPKDRSILAFTDDGAFIIARWFAAGPTWGHWINEAHEDERANIVEWWPLPPVSSPGNKK
jgi:hypothetical protein